jgi:hypothetical protein
VDELHLRAGELDHVAVAQRHRVAVSGTPLTLGRAAPSTCAKA